MNDLSWSLAAAAQAEDTAMEMPADTAWKSCLLDGIARTYSAPLDRYSGEQHLNLQELQRAKAFIVVPVAPTGAFNLPGSFMLE